MHRRTLLSLPALGALAATLTSCGKDTTVSPTSSTTPSTSGGASGPTRHTYGADPSQFGDLTLPAGTPKGTVVVIHGGFWLSEYDLSLGAPLAASLSEHGWAAWNLEYRRVGPNPGGGGGDPQTFDDVAAGIDMLRDLGVPLDTVITLGHSAGGHLGTWAASRTRFDAWKGGLELTGVVSQAGVLDLVTADREDLGGGAVQGFLGHKPGLADAPLDPQQQIPLDVPVHCVHGTSDQNVPISQSEQYVAAATAAGAKADLTKVEGDHFVLIDPTSAAWTTTLGILDSMV